MENMLPKIDRIYGPVEGRSTASVYSGLAFAVAYDPDMATTIIEQTRSTLKFLDARLADAGSDKTAILQATVYLPSGSSTDPALWRVRDKTWRASHERARR